MTDDFVVFSKNRKSVFRYRKNTDDSWAMLIRRECYWALHDNVGPTTAREAHDDPEHEIYLAYVE
jgi:hypothetical protein